MHGELNLSSMKNSCGKVPRSNLIEIPTADSHLYKAMIRSQVESFDFKFAEHPEGFNTDSDTETAHLADTAELSASSVPCLPTVPNGIGREASPARWPVACGAYPSSCFQTPASDASLKPAGSPGGNEGTASAAAEVEEVRKHGGDEEEESGRQRQKSARTSSSSPLRVPRPGASRLPDARDTG